LPPSFVPNSGQLRAAWLSAVAFKYNDELRLNEGLQYDLDIRPETTVDAAGSKATIHLAIVWDGEDESLRPFELEIAVSGYFAWEEEIADDYKDGWTQFNGLYLLWPYLRSYVTSITAQSVGEPLILPTLAVPRPGPNPDWADHEVGVQTPEKP
jgi:preprotein translocase subunit SecB